MSEDVDERLILLERKTLDEQITYLGGFALVALIVCIVLLFIFANTITGLGPALQTALVTITTRIQSIFPGGVQQLQNAVNLIQNTVENGLNNVTSAIADGVIQSLNVVASVGKQVLDTIGNGVRSILSILGEMGADTFQFFENVLQPIVTVVQIIGTLIIDALIIMYSQFAPISTLIDQIVKAIQTIGHKF